MNCREAQNTLFAERDSPLAADQQAALDAHLAGCGECQQVRTSLDTVLTTWRQQQATAHIPDAEREWHAVRRRIRSEGGETGNSLRRRFAWFAIPLGAAAAALAVTLYVGPFSLRSPEPAPSPAQTARISASGTEAVASTMVFVDDKSGWLVVWASEAAPRQL